jgi:amino acid adenylation domain-containing protein
MVPYHTFSSFIVGEGTLPIRCAEILLECKQTIYGMISADRAVHHWAEERGIPYLHPKDQTLITYLSQHPFDYLFSINNLSILPQRMVELPRRGAINFHDGPLPKYAGLYATSWAILQGERMHGVTWHAMTEQVDAGDILKQPLFEIDDDETAFTLNAKCYDVAISSFAELIDDLAYERVSARKQNLNERTFFSRSKRPSAGCILSWNRSAREIGALVRALDFGTYPNPMGLPKLALGEDFIIVSELEVLPSMAAVPPGTVTHIDPGFIRVATRDGEIALHKLLTIDGQPLPIADFVAQFGLYEGYQFKDLDPKTAARITAYYASICQYEAFWTKRLETIENLTLPYVHRKTPDLQTARRLCEPMPLPREFLTSLEAIGRLGDVLLAAFAGYLARIGGVRSFDLGYRGAELEGDVANLEGMFAASVPLHISMEHEQSFEEVFHAVQEQVQSTRRRKTYARDIMARYPGLRAKAIEQGAYVPSICVEQVEAAHDNKAWPGSELTLVIQEDRTECLWVYNAEVLDRESVVKMQKGFTAFLQGIVSDPQQHTSVLPLLTQQERERVLAEWNATQTDYPKETCLHQLFEAQVERAPEAVAVIFEGQHLTYRELNRRANQLAHHLRQLGVGPEVLVGLCVERSLDMMVGLLGILKAGGAYVPLDPAFPAERLAFMLEDSQAAVLVTQQHVLARLTAPGTRVVCLDADAAVLARNSEANPFSGVTSAQRAYVIYTSGSTGKPKGVQILHRAVVNFLLSMRQQPGLRAEDTWLAITTLSFDIAALELFLPLIVGARVVVASRETVINGAALAETLRREQVTVMQATPVTWRLLLEAGWAGKADLKILCGGEALSLDLAEHLLTRGASLWNMYGPTETTIWSTLCKIEPGQEVISIGRPIANTEVYLLDAHLQPVPVGVPGELCIGGDGLARGYLNRPELTAERFIPHPFSDEPGARLYRTGDLARYRTDGMIEHLGRLDFQVKLRGFRIELGEIEAVLSQHAAVRQAVVMAREDVPGNKRLVAYVVSQQPGPTSSELRDFLKEQLPDYMVPSAFVCLAALPQTPNGKVDRRALPAPELTNRTADKTFVAPRLRVHDQLISIWEELLEVRPIGIRDNFFELGGQSLLAARMLRRIEQVFGKKLPFVTLFAEPTIEHLANALLGEEDTNSRVLLGKEESNFLIPVVAVQAGGSRRPFFFLHGQTEGDAFYCFQLARELGADQPFYVLERYNLDGLEVPPTIEAMATAYLKSVRAVQPEGPYLLGGWCNGGLVAYEMARQLHAEGQAVDLLVLMDPGLLVYPTGFRVFRDLISRFGDLLGLGQDKQLDWFLRLRYIYRYARHAYRYLRYSRYRKMENSERLPYFDAKKFTGLPLGTPEQYEPGHRPGEVDGAFPSDKAHRKNLHQSYSDIFDWVALGYKPPTLYPGKITFFWTSGEPSHSGWRHMEEANEVEVYSIPGEHSYALTKHLEVLADSLSTCLSKAQAPHSAKEHKHHSITPDRADADDRIQIVRIPAQRASQVDE